MDDINRLFLDTTRYSYRFVQLLSELEREMKKSNKLVFTDAQLADLAWKILSEVKEIKEKSID